jgi:hypothetical protein
MNKKIIPILPQNIIRNKFSEDIDAWRNFAQRITKNPFVREYLFKRDGNKCSWCEKDFNKQPIIHHLSYDHKCTFNETTVITYSTEKKTFRERKVPNCQKCSQINSIAFNDCMNKLALVHRICNLQIAVAGNDS